MKTGLITLALILTGTWLGFSQSFVNLDFENTTTTILYQIGGVDSGTATIPGWTANALFFGDPNNIPYNNIALDNSAVDLEGTNFFNPAIQGNYSVLLQGGSISAQNTNGASIGQTGQIPIGTQSVILWANTFSYPGNTFQATFNGQPLSFLVTGSTATYAIYAADISADAGQTGLLQFSVPWESNVMIDNIQFSSSPAPEPSGLALAALGTLIFNFRRLLRLAK